MSRKGTNTLLKEADALARRLPEADRGSVLEVSLEGFRAQCEKCRARVQGVGFQTCEVPAEGGRWVSCDLWANLMNVPHARLRNQYPELSGMEAPCLPVQEMCLQIPETFSTLWITREGRPFTDTELRNVSILLGKARRTDTDDIISITSADFIRATASTPNGDIESLLCRFLEVGGTIKFE